jgi:anti-sigma-K factor RskA
MEHTETESLLGVYALHAVEADEARAVEEHLASCPRCRAELAALREVAAALGNFGAEAPEGVWERIAADVHAEDSDEHPAPQLLLPRSEQATARWHWRVVARSVLAGVAAAVVVLFGLQFNHVDNELNGLRVAVNGHGLSPLVASVALGPHRVITLTSAGSPESGRIEVAPGGTAYWVGASLGALSPDKTYQLWATVGGRIVSIGLLGSDPHAYLQLHLEASMQMIMATAEPEGETPGPTTPVLLAGVVPTNFV